MNPLMNKLKKEGCKFSKKDWPRIKMVDLKKWEISPEEIGRCTGQATIHQTMGPSWCYGFMLQWGKNLADCRPVYFKEAVK